MEQNFGLRNTTGDILHIADLGQKMPNGNNENLEEQFDFIQLCESNNLETAITNGQIVVVENGVDLVAAKGNDFLRNAHKKYVDDQISSVTIDTNISITNLQEEIDAIELASGLNSDGTFNPHIGTNYIDTATDAKVARELLDTQVKLNADNLSTEITNRINADNLKFDKTGGTITGDINILDNEIFTTSVPTSGTSLTNKTYVDSIASGFRPKTHGDIATTEALPSNVYNNGTGGVGATITGSVNGVLPTIDTITPVNGLFILVKNEVDKIKNGIYVITEAGNESTPFVLTRRDDMDGSPEGEMATGSRIYIKNGSANKGAAFTLLGTYNTNLICGTDEMNQGQTGGEAAVANLQDEVDTIELAVGLNADGSFNPHSGTNYIDSATNAKIARELLDTEIKVHEVTLGNHTIDIGSIYNTLSNMSVIEGRMYAKDTVRDKQIGSTLSYTFGLDKKVKNRFLQLSGGTLNLPVYETVTITAIGYKLNTIATNNCIIEIYKNNDTTAIYTLNVNVGDIINSIKTLDIPLLKDDYISIYINGGFIDTPTVVLEMSYMRSL